MDAFFLLVRFNTTTWERWRPAGTVQCINSSNTPARRQRSQKT